ncbi:MAG: ribonuclease P protein component [Paludibacter sp.]|nr:ribonuclease P protein component [Paludibacter sp.]
MDKNFAFPKKEHLCGDTSINRLYTEGKAFIVYPVRIVYKSRPGIENIPVKVLFSVPKRKFKRAVKRNRIKRLMRESYRHNKEILQSLCIEKNISIDLAFNFIGDAEPDFKTIESKMISAMNKIAEKLNF